MSKVLIDRSLLERAVYALQSAYEPDMLTTHDLQAVLTAPTVPSGTPELPVKAYYHEAPNEHGGFNKSVGLEQRKTFSDAPLVLESDALTQIACLEGEIAKRDEELAACRVAVENCELFRARIVELESRYQRDVYGLNNEGDPIGGDPAGGYANDSARLRSELSALKAQEPVTAVKHGPLDSDGWPEFVRVETIGDFDLENLPSGMKLYAAPVAPLYAAPAQQVSVPDELDRAFITGESCDGVYRVAIQSETLKEMQAVHNWLARINSAPAAPKTDDPVKQMLLEALEALEALEEAARQVMAGEMAASSIMVERMKARAAIAAARQEGGKV